MSHKLRIRLPAFLLRLFEKRERVAHYTVDGGRLCPCPGMTDEDLEHYERTFNVPEDPALEAGVATPNLIDQGYGG